MHSATVEPPWNTSCRTQQTREPLHIKASEHGCRMSDDFENEQRTCGAFEDERRISNDFEDV
jgi:hypothetical protein